MVIGNAIDPRKSAALDQMCRINPRRFELIDRQVRGQLSQSEVAELEDLHAEATRLADIIAPLPNMDRLVADVERLQRQILGGNHHDHCFDARPEWGTDTN